MEAKRPAKLACVVGWPAKHSRSPKLHRYWIDRYRLDADYRAEEISPEEFALFIASLADRGYVGCNVTMPHKEAAYRLSQPDEHARAVGAANTLWFVDGKLHATNTDVAGFLGALDEAAADWASLPGQAVILGAGGAARACIHALIERGIGRIAVVNRSFDKAQSLYKRFGEAIAPKRWEDLPELLPETTLLVNATSLGLEGHADIAIDLSPMPDSSLVADINYVPLRTGLLKRAEARSLRTANGLDMLIHQAVRGFELWFGIRPEITRELRDLLLADLAK